MNTILFIDETSTCTNFKWCCLMCGWCNVWIEGDKLHIILSKLPVINDAAFIRCCHFQKESPLNFKESVYYLDE